MTFKSGDIVRCVNGHGALPSYDLTEGDVFAVTKADKYKVELKGFPYAYCAERFVLANQKADSVPGAWLHSLSSDERKECAVSRGLFAYFPDALVMIARHSVRANEKHNPGQPVHWAREKSPDHEDCIARHSISVAIDPDAMDGDVPHIVCRAWRALAALQVWIERKQAEGGEL